WRREQRSVSRSKIQPVRRGHSPAGDHFLAGSSAGRGGASAGGAQLRLVADPGGVVRGGAAKVQSDRAEPGAGDSVGNGSESPPGPAVAFGQPMGSAGRALEAPAQPL